MIKFLKNLFRVKSEQERMYDYLSQATDQVHLEFLQKEYDRSYRKNWWSNSYSNY